MEVTWLRFEVAEQGYALPLGAVVEVMAAPRLHLIPRVTLELAGVVNVRGRIVPCVGFASLLRPIEQSGAIGKERLLVFRHEGWMFATRVDAVDGVHRVEARGLQPPPPPANASHFTTSLWTLDRRSIARLDEKRLFAAAKEALS